METRMMITQKTWSMTPLPGSQKKSKGFAPIAQVSKPMGLSIYHHQYHRTPSPT